jgi:hypothetical protein
MGSFNTIYAERRLDMATSSMFDYSQQQAQSGYSLANSQILQSSGIGSAQFYSPGQIPTYTVTTGIYPISAPECPKPQRRKTMLENVKGYVEKHKDMLFTLGLVILVDHFLFKGALRERIKGTVEGALKKVENSFHKEA